MNEHKKSIINLLKTAKGQIEGIITMVEKERYCLDISPQILSTVSILRKVNAEVISKHIDNCIINILEEGTDECKSVQLQKISGLLSKIN